MKCEGWTLPGSFMTFGPRTWCQCKNEAVVMLEVKQEKVEKQPACIDCWKKAIKIKKGITILSVEPIDANTPTPPPNKGRMDKPKEGYKTMKTVSMDIIFQGEQAEELRKKVKDAMVDIAFDHNLNADIEITSWNPDHDPIVIKK